MLRWLKMECDQKVADQIMVLCYGISVSLYPYTFKKCYTSGKCDIKMAIMFLMRKRGYLALVVLMNHRC